MKFNASENKTQYQNGHAVLKRYGDVGARLQSSHSCSGPSDTPRRCVDWEVEVVGTEEGMSNGGPA